MNIHALLVAHQNTLIKVNSLAVYMAAQGRIHSKEFTLMGVDRENRENRENTRMVVHFYKGNASIIKGSKQTNVCMYCTLLSINGYITI